MGSYHLGTLDGVTPSVHPDAWIAPGVVLVGRVTVGRAANVWYGSVLRADEDEIMVGPECNIQDQCCLHVDPGEPVILDERVSLGHRATVHGAHVGAGALIGIGAVVLGRARIGAGSLVAAGTVVRPGQQLTFDHLPLNDAKSYGLLLLVRNNPNELFSSFSAANPGGATQMVAFSDTGGRGVTFGIEDIAVASGHSDRDYNDLIVRFHPADVLI